MAGSGGPAHLLLRSHLLLPSLHAYDLAQPVRPPVPPAGPAPREPGGGSRLRPRPPPSPGGGAGGAGGDPRSALPAAPPGRVLPLDPGDPARDAGVPLSRGGLRPTPVQRHPR